MADNIAGRAERPEFLDDDPFAELTRIMGHDPRQQERATDQVDESLDLENELLGNLDLSQEDDFQPAPAQAYTAASAPVPGWDEQAERVYDTPAPEPVQASSSTVGADAADTGLDFAEFDAEISSAIDQRLDDEPAIGSDGDELDDDYFAGFEDEEVLAEEVGELPPVQQAAPAAEDWQYEDQPPPALDTANATPQVSADVTPQHDMYEDTDTATASTAYAPAEPRTEPGQSSSSLSLEEELTMLLAGEEKTPSRAAPVDAGWDTPAPAMPQEPAPVPPSAYEEPVPTSWSTDDGAREYAPEIETHDMAGYEPIRSEQLEVPELPVEEPVPPSADIDDLAAELNKAFDFVDGQATTSVPDAAAYATPVDDPAEFSPQEWEHDWDTAPIAVPAAGAAAGFAHTPHQSGRYEDDLAQEQFDAYRHDEPLEMETLEPPPVPLRPDNRRRNMMIAGGVVAVALIGVVGVLAMWSGGGSSGEPVLLQADADPVRVRPDEPGGTVVPNQDNEVYQRVAGGQDEPEPSQERLIDTAEEPIDLTTQEGPRIVGPRTELTADRVEDTDVAPVRFEERLQADDGQAVSTTANEDFVALQPRRVRTMVVRPDGTIVPREDPEPAVTEEVAPTPVTEQPAAELVETQPEAPTEMTEEVALAPATQPQTPVVTPQPPAQQTQTPPPAQTQQQVAAVNPTAVPTTQTSEWTMQIASQPSAESAQATYQDLARRYSSLLEGRGVNIVRANVEGRTYYRVRIPMASRDEAVSLCTRYQSAGGSCFVSR